MSNGDDGATQAHAQGHRPVGRQWAHIAVTGDPEQTFNSFHDDVLKTKV
jgi:hypothetical protein